MAGLESGDLFGSIGVSGSSLMSGMDAITTMIVYMFIAAFIGAVLFGCLYLLSFNKPVRVYEETSAGWKYVDTKARQFKTKDGITKWRFLKWIKESHPAPSNDVLFLNSKGKTSAEGIRSMDGNVQWVKRDFKKGSVEQLSGEEKAMMVQEMRRAEDYKKKKLGDLIRDIMPFIVLAMILIIFMVFFNDVVQPSVELGEQVKASSALQSESMNKMSEVCLIAFKQNYLGNGSQVLKPGDPFVPN